MPRRIGPMRDRPLGRGTPREIKPDNMMNTNARTLTSTAAATLFFTIATIAIAACEPVDPNAVEGEEVATTEETTDDALLSASGCDDVFNFMNSFQSLVWATWTYSSPAKVAMSNEAALSYSGGTSWLFSSSAARVMSFDDFSDQSTASSGNATLNLSRPSRRTTINGIPAYILLPPSLSINGAGISFSALPTECTVNNNVAIVTATDNNDARVIVRIYQGTIGG